jgi:hypothetical protein
MTLPTLLSAIVEALINAGATEGMIAAAIKADGEARTPQRAKWTAQKRAPKTSAATASRLSPPRSGLERSDFVPWPESATVGSGHKRASPASITEMWPGHILALVKDWAASVVPMGAS